MVLLKVFNLLHDSAENFWAILWWIPILDQADFNVKFEMIPYDLLIESLCKRCRSSSNIGIA